jgi:DNA-directed RNA polymerase specialized sigma24 family protein
VQTQTTGELEAMYAAYRPLLISIAYRMLGLLSDAEDIVQDVFVSMQRVNVEDVRHLKAYLVKMTTNRQNWMQAASKLRIPQLQANREALSSICHKTAPMTVVAYATQLYHSEERVL